MEARYQNVEKMIGYIKARPKMYVEEVRLDYIYYLLKGFLGCSNMTLFADEKDRAFKSDFYKWVVAKMKSAYNSDYSDRYFTWHHIIQQKANEIGVDAVSLFYQLSDEFFSEI